MPELSPNAAFQEQLRALRQTYARELPEKLRQIDALWDSLNRCWTQPTLHDMHRAAHSLAGSGATYGFNDLSYAARQVEVNLKTFYDGEIIPDEDYLDVLNDTVENLRRCIREVQPVEIAEAPAPAIQQSQEERHQQQIVIADDDPALLRDLAMQLTYFGYVVHTTERIGQLAHLVERIKPAVLVTGLTFPEGDLAGAMTVAQLQLNRAKPLPTIFLSGRRDLDARLYAVRAGGSAFFPEPIDISGLVDMLDRLSGQRTPEPYRVLIVEDSPMVGALYSAALRHEGIQTFVVSDPSQVMAPLDDFRPDLVLMDVYMPGCTGPELAAVIRQHPDFISLPIVFLSGETDPQAQLVAMQQGGDDFLTKPIPIPVLINAVLSRVRRARGVRAQMIRDGLTNLLNHTAIEHQLDLEIARAGRNRTPLAVALIDIDHFKQVNDLYGHPAGDRVIKGLARLLQQRLRRSDSIGRYGGEEFAILMPDTEGVQAQKVIDAIRETFGQIRHQAEEFTFTNTFSCGIASFPTLDNAKLLMGAADAALYRAKRGGRNQVTLNLSQPTADGWESEQSADARQPVRQARVTVVEPDQTTRDALQVWLNNRGCTVEIVSDGDALLASLGSEPPDIVLLNTTAPLIEPGQLMAAARDHGHDLLLILLLAAGDELALRDGLRGGATDYLRKPLEGREFQLIFDRAMGRLKRS